MNAWAIFWMVVVSVAVVSGCIAGAWSLQLVMVRTFLRHLDAHEQRCIEANKEQQKSSHDFHRELNDNTREAFKEVLRVIGEARDTMGATSVAATQIMDFVARMKGRIPPAETEETKGNQ